MSKVDQRYHLTSRGQGLRSVIRGLVRWGEPLMLTGRGDDAFSPRWLIPALDALLQAGEHARGELQVDGETIHTVSDDRRVKVGDGPAVGADVQIGGPAELILGIAAGHLDLAEAAAHRLVQCIGDIESAQAVFRRGLGSRRE